MLKAVKECLKNWLVVHERLYWYIVVGLAVLGFGIVTAFGCAKLEKANAADDYTGIIENMYDRYVENFGELSLDTHPYYVVIYNGTELYFVPSEWQGVVDFVNDSGPRFRKSDNSVFYATKYTFSSGQYGTYSGSRLNMNSLTQLNAGIIYANYTPSKSYDDEWRDGYLDLYYSVNASPVPSTKYSYFGKELEPFYSPDAPYVNFSVVSFSNLYLDGKPKLFHIGSTFDNKTKFSGWGYTGYLSDFDSTGATEYSLHVEFVVELPTWEYVRQLCELKGVPYYGWETCDKSQILRSVWDSNEDIPKYTYSFFYPVSLEDGVNFDKFTGKVSFHLSFEEIEVLLRYFDETAFSDLRADSAYKDNSEELRAHYLSYLHVDQVRIVVHADRVDSSTYGPMIVNSFQRNLKNQPIVKVIDIDYLSEVEDSINNAIDDSILSGLEEYYKNLEEKVDNLQGQIDDIYSVGEGFAGSLESTDLWKGFQNLSEGVSSLGPSISGISSLTGQVFAFVPAPISSIMYFTLFAVCIIAIIKAIRG